MKQEMGFNMIHRKVQARHASFFYVGLICWFGGMWWRHRLIVEVQNNGKTDKKASPESEIFSILDNYLKTFIVSLDGSFNTGRFKMEEITEVDSRRNH